MAIRCLFSIPDEGSPCQVLKILGATPTASTLAHLRARHCACGAFIACPVFRRVEEGLLEANQLRAPSQPAADSPSAEPPSAVAAAWLQSPTPA